MAKNRGTDNLPPLLSLPHPNEKPGMSIIYPLIVGDTSMMVDGDNKVLEAIEAK